MSGALSSGSTLAASSLLLSAGAAAAFPTFWPMTAEIFMLQCDPQAIFDAGMAWIETGNQISSAMEAATAIANDVAATGWDGPDFEAQAQRVQEFVNGLMVDMVSAISIGVMLIATAVAMFALILFAFIASTYLFACSIVYWSMLGSIVAAPGAPAYAAAMSGVAASVVSVFKTSSAVVDGVTMGFAALIGGFVAGGALGQLFQGNPEAVQNLGAASVDSIGTVTAGLMSYFLNKGIGQGIGAGMGPAIGVGVGGNTAGTASEPLNPVNWPGLFDVPQNTDGLPDR